MFLFSEVVFVALWEGCLYNIRMQKKNTLTVKFGLGANIYRVIMFAAYTVFPVVVC